MNAVSIEHPHPPFRGAPQAPVARSGDVVEDAGSLAGLTALKALTALMAKMAAGDQAALAGFYHLTVGRVYGLALRIVRCHALAEEVAEEVYVQAWHAVAGCDIGRASPLSWLLTICRSLATATLRRAARAQPNATPQPAGEEDLLEIAQHHPALHRALLSLQPQQSQMLALAFFCDMSHTEVAAHLHLAPATARAQLRRAQAALRKELGTD
jgi:RNA polymerase sigma-70 factor (ECF subfamily)